MNLAATDPVRKIELTAETEEERHVLTALVEMMKRGGSIWVRPAGLPSVEMDFPEPSKRVTETEIDLTPPPQRIRKSPFGLGGR